MFEWKPEYSVQIGSIDGQHQNLFRIAKELYDAMSAGKGKAALSRILDRLVQYTAVHFAHEERLMRQFDFPNLATHLAEHQVLTQRVLTFQSEYQAGRAAMTVQVLQFLRDWLEHHIAGSDQQYSPYLRSKAVA